MSNIEIALALKVALISWLTILAVFVAIQLLRGGINTAGLLRSSPDSNVDPERIAMLLVTLLVTGGYAFMALSGDLTFDPGSGRPRLPDVPDVLLALLAGGNTTYLAGKISRR